MAGKAAGRSSSCLPTSAGRMRGGLQASLGPVWTGEKMMEHLLPQKQGVKSGSGGGVGGGPNSPRAGQERRVLEQAWQSKQWLILSILIYPGLGDQKPLQSRSFPRRIRTLCLTHGGRFHCHFLGRVLIICLSLSFPICKWVQ